MRLNLESDRWSVFAMASASLVLASLVGCGGGSPATLSGSVDFSGEPVAKGTIRLLTEEGTAGEGGSGAITDGKYSITGDMLKAGKHKVAIFAFRKTGEMVAVEGGEPDSLIEESEEGEDGEGSEEGAAEEGAAEEGATMEEDEEQYIPGKYNQQSTEIIELTAGANTKDFDLQP